MLPPTKGSIDEILNGRNQFVIPVYQRTYNWEKKQCKRLWNDIVTMQKEQISNHFIGSIVNVAERYSPTGIKKHTIIDGQQRVTTLVLLLVALRDYLVENQDNNVHIKPEVITDIYLKNSHQDDDGQYKLLLTQTDKETLINLIESFHTRIDESSRLYHNYRFFYDAIVKNEISANDIYESIQKLEIVNITLERDRDNPQQIFESLNSTGMDLSQSDLIRNYVLMGLEPSTQSKIFNNYWHPMEKLFHYEHQASILDEYFRDYITARTGKIPVKDKVYDEYKFSHPTISDTTVEEICKDLYSNAVRYANMQYAVTSDDSLNKIFKDIKSLRMNVAYPLLINVYKDYDNNEITKEDFIEILNLCESYVFRRSVCSIPTNSLNKTFSNLYFNIDVTNYLNSFKYILFSLDSYKVFPTDEVFYDNFLLKDMYNSRTRVYLLNKLENHQNKAPITSENFTIEHIMPQNKNLSDKWQNELGNDWKNVQKKYVHTIGNLTLTAYNSEMSDRPFSEKIKITGGFKESALRLNKYVINQASWNEQTILERGEELYNISLGIWEYPYLSEDDLNTINRKDNQTSTEYSIEDYSFSTESKELYKDLDRAILNRFPDTRKEYKKEYIAYKYETNYSDIIPQKQGLKIIINLKFSLINDPKHMGRDVTNIGKWGNGDMEIKLTSPNDIDYVLDLIEQAYSFQAE